VADLKIIKVHNLTHFTLPIIKTSTPNEFAYGGSGQIQFAKLTPTSLQACAKENYPNR
jgi:hypothetical protein